MNCTEFGWWNTQLFWAFAEDAGEINSAFPQEDAAAAQPQDVGARDKPGHDAEYPCERPGAGRDPGAASWRCGLNRQLRPHLDHAVGRDLEEVAGVARRLGERDGEEA